MRVCMCMCGCRHYLALALFLFFALWFVKGYEFQLAEIARWRTYYYYHHYYYHHARYTSPARSPRQHPALWGAKGYSHTQHRTLCSCSSTSHCRLAHSCLQHILDNFPVYNNSATISTLNKAPCHFSSYLILDSLLFTQISTHHIKPCIISALKRFRQLRQLLNILQQYLHIP